MKSRALVSAVAVAVAAVTLLVVDPAPASAGHSWSNYHWRRTSGEVNLTLVDSVTGTWQAQYDRARTEWAQSGVLALASENGGDTQGTRKRCAAPSGQVRVCNAAYGFNGWLGVAQIWVWPDGHIAQGVTKMNDSYSMRPAEKQYVMCQEIGHTFGLGHQDENHDNKNVGSCMDYSRYPEGGVHSVGGGSIDYGPNNESPNTDTAPGGTGEQHGDFEQLLAIYNHLESAGAAPATSTGDRGRSEEAGNTPDEWGRPVRSDAEGRPILYRRDRPDRVSVFTWVLWARGHGQQRESD
jgi:hypothetical protein